MPLGSPATASASATRPRPTCARPDGPNVSGAVRRGDANAPLRCVRRSGGGCILNVISPQRQPSLGSVGCAALSGDGRRGPGRAYILRARMRYYMRVNKSAASARAPRSLRVVLCMRECTRTVRAYVRFSLAHDAEIAAARFGGDRRECSTQLTLPARESL